MSDLDAADEYATVPTAATMLGISPERMHYLLKIGRIPYIVPNKQKRVRVADVQAYRHKVSRRGEQPARRRAIEDVFAS